MHWEFLRVDGWDLVEVSFLFVTRSVRHACGVFHVGAGIAGEHVSARHFDRTQGPGVKGAIGRIQLL
jgi:hypothetical protein